jgi:hypothetical protein
LFSTFIAYPLWLIKVRTGAKYNHVMMLVSPEEVATQNWLYKRLPLKKYMTRKHRLLFIEIDVPIEAKNAILKNINKDLSLSWNKRRYDVLGIVGQIFGINRLNNKKRYFCSERVVDTIKYAYNNVGADAKKVLDGMPAHEDPEGLKSYMLMYNKYFKVRYGWSEETGFVDVLH